MSMKKKIVETVTCAMLALANLYTGICFVATLLKAVNQAYLHAKTVNYYFMGYFMTDTVYGIAFIVSGLLLYFLIRHLAAGYKN